MNWGVFKIPERIRCGISALVNWKGGPFAEFPVVHSRIWFGKNSMWWVFGMQGSLKLNKTVSKVIYWSVEKKPANITLLIIQRKILSALEKSRISLADQNAGQTIISPFCASINDPPYTFSNIVWTSNLIFESSFLWKLFGYTRVDIWKMNDVFSVCHRLCSCCFLNSRYVGVECCVNIKILNRWQFNHKYAH